MLKKAARGIWEITREENGKLTMFIYRAKRDGTGVLERDANGAMIPVMTDWIGLSGHDPQEIYDALVYLFPELIGKESDPTDFDERVAATIKRLAETDKDLIERIKNYTDDGS